MADWRESILKEFIPRIAPLTLVADPDDLLVEEVIQQGLRERGFEVMRFDDAISFRFAYESRFRCRWDKGETGDLVVLLADDASNLKNLPSDLLQKGRCLSFSLAGLFPGLSYPVVASLDRGDLDLLVQAMPHHAGDAMGETHTKDFLLRHIFQIAPEWVREPADLLHLLLRRHYRGQNFPAILNDRLVWLLRQRRWFEEWPLEEIVPDRQAFFGFLQDRWPVFLRRLVERIKGNPYIMPEENESSYGMKYPGPAVLPFDHEDVRIYVDNLFFEGLLKPVNFARANLVNLNWVVAGIHHDPEADRLRRLDGLLEKCRSSLPSEGSRHREWLHYARHWSQLSLLAHDPERPLPQGMQDHLDVLQGRLDETFQKWMEKRFAGLHNQPAIPPVMVHHIPREMARSVTTGDKVALVVLDGMAMEQWLVVREVLAEQRPGFVFQEDAVFAWVPTITAISRQAIFAGSPPLYFPTTLHTTQQEPILWKRFWDSHGVASSEVGYVKGMGDGSLKEVEKLVANSRMRVVGIVVDMIDRIMHGMELGSAGMQSAVRQWVRLGFMAGLLDVLVAHGFQVMLTSDHGNVEALGMGRPSEGATADVRGERCRIYPDTALRAAVLEQYPETQPWPSPGLPDGCHPLLATGRSAFTTKGCRIVGHGGVALEEVIVPFVRLEGGES